MLETLVHIFFDGMLVVFLRGFWIQPMIASGASSASPAFLLADMDFSTILDVVIILAALV